MPELMERKTPQLIEVGRTRRHLWLVNQFAVAPGDPGGTRHFELGRELLHRGWEVTIIASDLGLHSRRYSRRFAARDRGAVGEDIEGVHFEWLWASPYDRNDWRRAANWLSFAREVIRTRSGARRPDVVIGSSPTLLAALAASRLAAAWKIPFVLEVRDLWPESLLAAGGGKGLAYTAFAQIAKQLYARATKILVLARGVRDHLAAAGIDASKIVYIPNGIDVAGFTVAQRHRDSRLQLIYAGAHGPANGLEAVLGAAELLRDRREIEFILVGDGPSKASLCADAEARNLENVRFLTPVPKREMPELLKQAGAGLMVLRDAPLFSYGVSPNKLFDYFGAGLPVVCNVPGDVERMVHAAGAGEQARDSSATALAEAIVRLAARSAEERRRMGSAAREWVAAEHGRAVLAERLDQVLRPLVTR